MASKLYLPPGGGDQGWALPDRQQPGRRNGWVDAEAIVGRITEVVEPEPRPEVDAMLELLETSYKNLISLDKPGEYEAGRLYSIVKDLRWYADRMGRSAWMRCRVRTSGALRRISGTSRRKPGMECARTGARPIFHRPGQADRGAGGGDFCAVRVRQAGVGMQDRQGHKEEIRLFLKEKFRTDPGN